MPHFLQLAANIFILDRDRGIGYIDILQGRCCPVFGWSSVRCIRYQTTTGQNRKDLRVSELDKAALGLGIFVVTLTGLAIFDFIFLLFNGL